MDVRATAAPSPFSRLVWRDAGHLRVGAVSFVVQEYGAPDLEPPVDGEPCFVLYKNRSMLDRYAQCLDAVGVAPARIFEIGIWKAGSAVLFTEVFDVEKLVAIDLKRRTDLADSTLRQIEAWRRIPGRADRASLYFEVDQADTVRVREIVRREFSGRPLDLVIDDASHLYEPTKRAFETLFPHVRPGGWYVIEDWSWSFNPIFQLATHVFALEVPLARLIGEILQLAGARGDLIAEIRVMGSLVFIRRGAGELDESFSIEASMPRRPYGRAGVRLRRAWWTLAELVGRRRR
jgi:hypothetical protein